MQIGLGNQSIISVFIFKLYYFTFMRFSTAEVLQFGSEDVERREGFMGGFGGTKSNLNYFGFVFFKLFVNGGPFTLSTFPLI